MTILIIGAYGQLGWELMRQQTELPLKPLGVDVDTVDITDAARIAADLDRMAPEIVINAAAYTAVDGAESESEAAYRVNRDGPAHLAAWCRANDAALIHVSTDFVFDGTANRPYRETDPVGPLGVYGQSKADGEMAVREALDTHVIVRTSWLYGVHGHNFVHTMLNHGRRGTALRVVSDQYGSPTFAADLANALTRITQRIAADKASVPWGTYHYCGKGTTSWHGFSETIFELARPLGLVDRVDLAPISTDEYPLPATRPVYSAMDCEKIASAFNITVRPWKTSLRECLERIASESSGNQPNAQKR